MKSMTISSLVRMDSPHCRLSAPIFGSLKWAKLGAVVGCLLAITPESYGESIATSADVKLTATSSLKNGIPVVARETPGSEIVHIEVSFHTGTATQTPSRRAINLLTFEAMPYATKKYSKQQIFALTEKYSIAVACKGGVEVSVCEMETIKEYLPQALDLLVSIVAEPLLSDEDVNLAKKQRVANFQQDGQDPEAHVNSVVNSIFYEPNHPFRLLPEDGIKQTQALTAEEMRSYQRTTLDSSIMFIVYAGPKIEKSTLAKLDAGFGKFGKIQRQTPPVTAPVFDPSNSFAFDHRPIPTAYIRMKFNAPSATSPDAPAAEVMFEILGEILHEEVRTKRSLSYAVHAATIQYSQGIGMIAASTSKPQETLVAIADVVRNFRDKTVSQEDLDEYRNVFTTSYYLTLETHDQLASALSLSQAYFGDAAKIYDLPNKLGAVTPADIHRVANEILKNFRVGIVYDKDKFKSDLLAPIKAL
jgi:zinc protease